LDIQLYIFIVKVIKGIAKIINHNTIQNIESDVQFDIEIIKIMNGIINRIYDSTNQSIHIGFFPQAFNRAYILSTGIQDIQAYFSHSFVLIM
jgi:hypothetical protein